MEIKLKENSMTNKIEVKDNLLGGVATVKLGEKKYTKLDKTASYDKELLEEYVEAANELTALKARVETINRLLDDNSEMAKLCWRTSEGVVLAVHKIEDDHLRNIMSFLLGRGRDIPEAVKSEARRRDIAVPVSYVESVEDVLYKCSDNFCDEGCGGF